MDDREAFRHYASEEADRYGSDDWVWVRELLQNARDAGATVQHWTCDARGLDGGRIGAADDGGGMTLPHARRFLLALYASSKDGTDQAGRFGVGFWSVLRFRPSSIVVRSRTPDTEGWQLRVRGDLEDASSSAADLERPGTEIELVRADLDVDRARKSLREALLRYGRFLMQSARPAEPLAVFLDGEPLHRPFELEAPSVVFAGRGYRGVVALGREPRVELFSHGLLVRSTPFLRDLVEDRRSGTGEPTPAWEELPAAAPRVLLDSSRLDLLIARSDARQDRHLDELVRRAERELKRLVHRQLEALHPQPWWRIGASRVREHWEEHRTAWGRGAAAVVLALLMGGAAATMLGGRGSFGIPGLPDLDLLATASEEASEDPAADPSATDLHASAETPGIERGTGLPAAPLAERKLGPRPHEDLSERYRGPSPASEPALAPLDLRYEPAGVPLFFGSLRLREGDDTSWEPADPTLGPYAGRVCRDGCVDVAVRLSAGAEAVRLPVPTGHLVDATSVRRSGRELALRTTTDGEPLVDPLPDRAALVTYRTGPAPSIVVSPEAPLPVPEVLRPAVDALGQVPDDLRLLFALEWTARTIEYRPAPRWLAARDPASWLRRAIETGAGDCDVQNAVVAALMQRAGRPARLVVGSVGAGGRALPGLHAWAEVLLEDGRWQAADASVTAVTSPAAAARALPVAGAGATVGTEVLGPPLTALGSPARGGSVPDAPSGSAIDRNPHEGPGSPAAGEGGSSDSESTRSRTGLLGAPFLVLFGVLVFLGLRARRRRIEGDVRLGPDDQLPALLAGALRHPESFLDLPTLRHGRYIPLLGGEAISLRDCMELAGDRRLLVGGRENPLGRRATSGGHPVLDVETEEARVVANALPAVDLDEWQAELRSSSEDEIITSLATLLSEADLDVRRRGASDRPAEPDRSSPALLDLRRHALGPDVLLLPGDDAAVPGEEGPEGLLRRLDDAVHRVGLSAEKRAELLHHAAARVLADRFGRNP